MIIVTGGAGFIGRRLVARLLREGYTVRVITPPLRTILGGRSLPATFEGLAGAERLTVVPGALENVEALHRVMLGVHTVFHLASAGWEGRPRDLKTVDLGGMQNIIAAARSARVGRVIVLSHLGASPASGFALLKIKGEIEEAVKTSGLAYTIFRCGVVFGEGDQFVNGIARLLRANPLLYFQPGHGEGLLHPIYIDDLIEALIRSLDHLDTVDALLSVGGPEYVTYNEMVRTIMRVTRARRTIVNIPPYLLRAINRLTHRLFPAFPGSPQWFDILAGNRTAPMGTLYNVFGIHPVRFEDTILTYMPKRRYRAELMRTLLRRRA